MALPRFTRACSRAPFFLMYPRSPSCASPQPLDFRLVRPETSFELKDVLAELFDQKLRIFDRRGLASGRLLAPARVLVVHLLLRRAVSDDLCPEAVDQLHDTVNRRARAGGCRGCYECEEESNDVHSRCSFVRTAL